MSLLIIAEKPSVAKDIANAVGGCSKRLADNGGYEGDNLVVSSAFGHLAGLHVPEADNFPPLPIIPSVFGIKENSSDTKKRLVLLKSLMKRADIEFIVNACDAGREGELIFHYINQWCNVNKPVKRMWLQSMTDSAILEAYNNMKSSKEYEPLLDSACSRSEADWLIGINSSRAASNLQHKRLGGKQVMGVGRVQTPTLALIVHRENEINNFTSKAYFEVIAEFQSSGGSYYGKYKNDDNKSAIDTSEHAQKILDECNKLDNATVTEVTKPSSLSPPKLFDLTTLQRECNKKFGFTAKNTLDIAQSLYEKHKVLSYPRTDSSCLPEDYGNTVSEILTKLDSKYQPFIDETTVDVSNKKIFNNKKISDHFAITPNGNKASNLDDRESKVYDLVCSRFIASFMPNAEYSKTARITNYSNNHKFYSNGQVMLKEGWQKILGKEVNKDEDNNLCKIKDGESVSTSLIEVKPLKTKPPAKFNESSLLGAMETAGKTIVDESLKDAMKGKGLGTPATRAPTIEGLLNKEYLVRDKKLLLPTQKGLDLVAFLEDSGIEILTSAVMTGDWEHKLDLMQKREYSRKEFMGEVAKLTTEIVNKFKEKAKDLPARANNNISEHTCSECKSDNPLMIFDDKYRAGVKVLWCRDCKSSYDIDGESKVLRKKKAPSGKNCLSCKNNLAVMTDKYPSKDNPTDDGNIYWCGKCKKAHYLSAGKLIAKKPYSKK